jgi:hypothetical protein
MNNTLSLEGDEKWIESLVSKGGRETSQNLKADGRILLKRVMTKNILVCEINSAGLG